MESNLTLVFGVSTESQKASRTTLPETNIALKNMLSQKETIESYNHQFSGAVLVSGTLVATSPLFFLLKKKPSRDDPIGNQSNGDLL